MADPLDPTTPPDIPRQFISSSPSSNPSGAAVAPSVQPSLSIEAAQFRPIQRLAAAIFSAPPIPVLLAARNNFRKSVLIRVLGGDATTVVGIVQQNFSAAFGGAAYLPILNGETVTLDTVGDIYVCVISGTYPNVFAAELMREIAQ